MNKILYLVSLRSYSAELGSFILALNLLKGDQESWFDIAFLCSEPPVDSRVYEDFLRCSIFFIWTRHDEGIYAKLPHATGLIQNYRFVCVCTADDIWSVPETFSRHIDKFGDAKVVVFNFLCAQPIESRRLLVWSGFQQLQLASSVESLEDRLDIFSSQGPMTVHAIYESSYLLDLIVATSCARAKLTGRDIRYENLLEDLINIANLAVGLTASESLWALRYMNSHYNERSGFVISLEIVRSLGLKELREVCEAFYALVCGHLSKRGADFYEKLTSCVEQHSIGYQAANSRFYREGFDVLLCTAENITVHNISAGRKGWPIRVLSSGAISAKDLPIASRISGEEPLRILNLPSVYWEGLDFKEWK